MSKREQILAALHAVLRGVDPAILRNEPLGTIDGEVFNTLRDGEIDLVEEYFNPPIYEFTASPNIILVVERGDSSSSLDTLLDSRIGQFVTALEAVTDLGCLITALRVQPADYAPRELFGTEDKKAAEVTIEIDYWSEHSSG